MKWAGGKSQLLPQLRQLIPRKFSRYVEPFVGGGALFFDLVSKIRFEALLSDINPDLINAYRIVKNEVDELIASLRQLEKEYRKNPKKYYYELRANAVGLNNVERAARFITLNKTCYNGLYRVNRKGEFNVPIGRYKNPLICDDINLRNVSTILNDCNVKIVYSDYKNILLEKTQKGDFVYLDPPYSPVSSTANFTSYTDNRFTDEDQRALADIFKKLTRRGISVLLSNSNTRLIKELYRISSIHITEVNAKRAINSKASNRIGHSELLIRNY